MAFLGFANSHHSDRMGAGIIGRMPLLLQFMDKNGLSVQGLAVQAAWDFGLSERDGLIRQVEIVAQALKMSILLMSMWTK